VEEQCTVCGQLMGMSEFLLYTISKSAPVIFKLQREKYCLKRVGNYSFVSRLVQVPKFLLCTTIINLIISLA